VWANLLTGSVRYCAYVGGVTAVGCTYWLRSMIIIACTVGGLWACIELKHVNHWVSTTLAAPCALQESEVNMQGDGVYARCRQTANNFATAVRLGAPGPVAVGVGWE
jgi:hypothetical protein